ncbi:LytR/AlgR family response regulator transcription factor [Winogradskyella immobilis]|uniref:Response regulator n=1 Tax=Winogradskyella immobilis TaxID=2816852 RepID=A0ABS8EP95_9FLAO|nr:response regulator [Winogradskyella immobilis]MCC1484137.1 response regulator [Winogradskyella immobilis]MCG0016229.1 response regulator [Winogradskyella immobilis]
MSKVKILVVEDEIIIADNICDTLNSLGYKALEPAVNYTEAIELIENENPDIAILDIQLSGQKTGIDLAKKIKEDYNFPFIFLTSNADVSTVNEAKKVIPPAYLIKPFTKEELYTSIEIALYSHSEKISEINDKNVIIKDALFIKEKGVYNKLAFDDILYFKSSHVYIEIFVKEKKRFIIRGSLNDIINKVNSKFIRVHRGFIINTEYLDQIDSTSLKINNEIIPIGKKYRQDILNKINKI